jgi:uncharacterized protein with GYD domain
MATYILLGKWTQQGAQGAAEGGQRRQAAKEVAKSFGGEIKQTYLTMGQYDIVAIVDAPDDESVAKIALKVGSFGNLSTQTLRAFDEAETDRLYSSI